MPMSASNRHFAIMLDLVPLKNAIAQLEGAMNLLQTDLPKKEPGLAVHLQAGAIQAFEFTYELCFKMLKRFLQETEPNPSEISLLTFRDMMRLGYERELLKAELPEWENFRKNRGTTSHTYDQRKAEEVLAGIPAFLSEARHLLQAIASRQDGRP
jgi:nucleotidyltransferase substrate binding protein (TIGR01987 family)